MQTEKAIIIGAGPCGLSTALELKKNGIDPLLIEKGNVAETIYHYPTHQTFFSSSEKLEIGNIPFVTDRQKPVRNEALTYYRTVADRTGLRIHNYEEVKQVEKKDDTFIISTTSFKGEKRMYEADYAIIATGYYDQPNLLEIDGEDLPHVYHYFKEAHPYFQKNVVVIGGKNSAVDTTIELEKAGANVTVLYRGADYSPSVKPWILPLFDSLMRNEKAKIYFNASPIEITESHVVYEYQGKRHQVEADFVFAMTGYQPDQDFLQTSGINVDEEAQPAHHPDTMETNIKNLYVSGVVASGYNNNKIFIENGRFHGELIAADILNKQ